MTIQTENQHETDYNPLLNSDHIEKSNHINYIKMRSLTTLLLILLFQVGFSQKFTIHGTARDSVSGEALIGGGIQIKELNVGIQTNSYGFYSITLPAGKYTVLFNYLGYEPTTEVIDLKSDILLNLNVPVRKTELKEVVVRSDNQNIESTNTSKNIVSINSVKSLSTMTGEPDVLKSLQMLPGVQTTEGSTNLYVRGGSFDQNLVLLDEAPVYNVSHALGMFSTFNADAIKSIIFYKGCYPAQYGGRLSSVIDIAMKEGDNKEFKVSGGVGIVASHLTVEGPIVKSKVSFAISARYSYAGWVLNKIASDQTFEFIPSQYINNQNDIRFNDLTAKINYEINNKNKLYFSAYSGNDHFLCYVLNKNNVLDWGNLTSTLRWNHIFTSKLFSNITLYTSNYNYSYYINNDRQTFLWKSGIHETGLKNDFTYYTNPSNIFKFGINVINRKFEPGNVTPKTEVSITKPISLEKKYNDEISLYMEHELKINKSLCIDWGFRHTLFIDLGPSTTYTYNESKTLVVDSTTYGNNRIVKFYQGFEPRLSIRYLAAPRQSIKFAYSHIYQYMHLLSNSTVGLPTDTWMPADQMIKPQSAHQFVVGYYSSFRKDLFNFTAESYCKLMENISDFKDNADLFVNKHVDTQILQGKGISYGLEFMLEKKTGKLIGWISYTLNKTKYKIDGINNNQYYSPTYDIRNNFSINAQYKFAKRWSLGSSFKYSSGSYATIPEGTYFYNGIATMQYNGRNGYKLPDYHRLDFSLSYKTSENKKYRSGWDLSIYNVYNRKNIYSLFTRSEDYTVKTYSMYMLGIVPTLSYNFNF